MLFFESTTIIDRSSSFVKMVNFGLGTRCYLAAVAVKAWQVRCASSKTLFLEGCQPRARLCTPLIREFEPRPKTAVPKPRLSIASCTGHSSTAVFRLRLFWMVWAICLKVISPFSANRNSPPWPVSMAFRYSSVRSSMWTVDQMFSPRPIHLATPLWRA